MKLMLDEADSTVVKEAADSRPVYVACFENATWHFRDFEALLCRRP